MVYDIMNILLNVIYIGGLLINSVTDICKRQVSMIIAVFMGSCGLCWRIYTFTDFSVNILLGLLPGILCLILASLTGESIGYGDGWILLVMGLPLDGQRMMALCVVALLTAGICALILIVIFHKDRKYQMPFVPFLLFGYLCILFT